MVLGIFHKGSGLGNQLFRYVTTRVLALDKGYDFSMINPEGFLGSSFINLDMGKPNNIEFRVEEPTGRVVPHTDLPLWEEKKVVKNGIDIRGYDPEFQFINDNTIIDGEFQGEQYFAHRKDEIREWLKVKDLNLPENLCIINFRGGEYVNHPELFLAQAYWDNAIANVHKTNPSMEFEVVTDDIKTARKFFPELKITHKFENDYTKIQNAHYLILSNSSFALLPAWLNQKVKMVIAPKYWARHNVSDGYWACEYNIVNGWMYQNRAGNLEKYDKCLQDLKTYKEKGLKDTAATYYPPATPRYRIKKILKKFKLI